MAHCGKLPPYQRIITTHNSEGKAVIAKEIDVEAPFDGSIQGGTVGFSLAYTTTQFPVDMNDGKDLAAYNDSLTTPPGIVQSSGSILRVVDVPPASLSPMHRTISLDYGIVLIGDMELVLDSGETRLMRPGDVCIQRGTMHAWRNISKTAWGRMIYVLQPSIPVIIKDQELKEDYGNMEGVRSST